MVDRSFLFLTASTRTGGNSLALAQRAAQGLPIGTAQYWIDLHALPLPPFADIRPGFAALHPTEKALLSALTSATDVVLAVPIYWYAFPASVHRMLEYWSGWLDVPDLGFAATLAGKRQWLITARADPAPDVPQQAEAIWRRSGAWLGMNWGGALHGVGNAPGEVLNDTATITLAPDFFIPHAMLA